MQRRISDLADDIKQQVISDIKNAEFILFSIQQVKIQMFLLALSFRRYFTNTNIKKEFLFCSALETNTKGVDAMEKISECFKCGNLKWENLCGVCSGCAPLMQGVKSSFQTLVQNLSPKVITFHCMIHRQVLTSKTLTESLHNVFKEVIKTVNYVKSGALNSRIFRNLFAYMGSGDLNLLY